MKKLLAPLLALAFTFLGPKTLKADATVVQSVGPFAGLNTNQAPEALDSKQSPDLLNVDVSPGGVSVKKRQGYGLDANLTISTSPVHNLYKFFDSNGNEVRLAFNDFKVNASVNGSAWSVILTTGITLGSTWDCTDNLGFAYCVSNAFDCPIKTNGTSAGTTGVCGTNGVPLGSVVSNSGDRLLVGATSANPNRLYYSQSTVFTNFALGVQPSDSSFEDILAPGSKITHLAYRFGRWLWWKDQSFGFLVGTGQFDLNLVVVSNSIGTLDNTDVFDGSYCYFRGSDAQIYTYDGSTLSRAISSDIFPTLNTANRRKSNQWVQSSQADFQTGTNVPTNNLSETISPGDVIVSSFSANEFSTSAWNSGTQKNFVLGISSISLATADGNIPNNGFESASANWTLVNATVGGSVVGVNCTLAPRTGSAMLNDTRAGVSAGDTYTVSLKTCSSGTLISSTPFVEADNSCTWTSRTLSSVGAQKKSVKIVIDESGTITATSDCFSNSGTNVTFYTASDLTRLTVPVLRTTVFDDITSGSDTITSGYYNSQVYNTGFASSTIQLQSVFTVNTSTPTFALLHSTGSTGPWATLLTSTGTNGISNRFVLYTTTISYIQGQDALTSISSVTILSRSTGTYYSAVRNAPSLTSFNEVSMTDSVPGASAINYFSRSSTSTFTVLSSTPAWISQPKNATVVASSGTFFQLRADFSITAATETPMLSDFTFNWFEGNAADKMYGTYYANSIWFSVSLGTSTTTNNRILRYDLLSQLWTPYDISSNGFLTYNNGLYFGSPTVGKVFQFGNNVYSDNGAAINAYWKSKPFFGDSPFTDKDLKTASWYVAEDSGTTLTMNYYLNETTTTVTKSINLYSANNNFIRSNYNFPAGTAAGTFSAQFGDNSTNTPWEVFGGLITFVPRPWVVTP